MISLTLKSWLALPLFVAAGFQIVSALELLGRTERRLDGARLRLGHRTVGWIAFAWLVIVSGMCVLILRASGGIMTPRGSVHSLTALVLLAVLIVKILIVRSYRKLFSFVVPFGFTAFILLLVTLALSAGTHLVASTGGRSGTPTKDRQALGERVFVTQCADCHYSDKEETKIGPGLGGLSKGKSLPSSGRSATVENIKGQLNSPYGTMPAFGHLPEEEKEAVASFLLGR